MTSDMLALFMKLADLDVAGMDSTRTVQDKTAMKRTDQNDAQYWLSTLKMLSMKNRKPEMNTAPSAICQL